MPKLTEAVLRKALSAGVPAGKTFTMIWDADPTGLGLKIRATNSHSWIFTYRPKGAGRAVASRTVTLGSYSPSAFGLDEARTAAKKLVADIVGGGDPAAQVRHEKSREKRVLSAAIEEHGKAMKRRRLVNADQVESALKRGLAGVATREVDTLTRADIVGEIEKLEAADKPGAAAYLRTNVHTFLEWCVSKGYCTHNVMAGLRRPKATRAERLEDEQRRGKALSDDEIVAVWRAAEKFVPFGGLVRLAILTGLRRNELAGLEWGDVEDDRIVIAAHRAKTGARHEVPLTTAMRAVLTAQPRAKAQLVFGSLKKPGAELSGWSKLLPKLVTASGVTFTLHDLRRTCRTIMSRIGVKEDIAELAIGHARADLVARYNKDDGWSHRVDAFAKVSAHVGALLAPGVSTVPPADLKQAAGNAR